MSKNDTHSQPSGRKPYNLGKERAIIKKKFKTFSINLTVLFLSDDF